MDRSQTTDYRAFLAQRRAMLLERIGQAARRAGREISDVSLLAVSKTVGDQEVVLAHEVGYTLFGENRPQELKRKVSEVRNNPALGDVRFHMIGNLQTNKINQVLGNATLLHSVSSVHLAEAVARRSSARDCVTNCLLEVNVSGEQSKAGFSPDELREVIDHVMDFESLRVEGLMTMAPAHDADAARRAFCGLRELKEELQGRTGASLPILSCGMSGDFEIAVEEGSTLVRLGRIVFDPAYEDM